MLNNALRTCAPLAARCRLKKRLTLELSGCLHEALNLRRKKIDESLFIGQCSRMTSSMKEQSREKSCLLRLAIPLFAASPASPETFQLPPPRFLSSILNRDSLETLPERPLA